MTIRAAQFAIALALISPIVIATSYPSLAASGCSQNGGAGCFKKGTRPHIVRRYYNYAPQLRDADYQALQEVLEK
jgi:hypothetical protein